MLIIQSSGRRGGNITCKSDQDVENKEENKGIRFEMRVIKQRSTTEEG
jgi:hypothetical protein